MMKRRFRAQFVCLALFLGAALIASPVVFGATGMVSEAGVTKIGVDNVIDKVDCLSSFLRNERQMEVPLDFADNSGVIGMIEGMADPEGYIPTGIDDPDLAANDVILQVAKSLLSESNIGEQNSLILSAFIAELDDLPEGYCVEAFEPAYKPVFDFERRDDDCIDCEKRKPDTGNFIYYGREYNLLSANDGSNLTDDVYPTGNGLIGISEPLNDNAPIIAPLGLVPEGGGATPTNVIAPPVETTADSGTFQRFAYGTEEDEPLTEGPFSATLFMNENSEESDTGKAGCAYIRGNKKVSDRIS